MAYKKDVNNTNMLLLGIVAILAIVGLVLLFTSPAATGKAWFPPQVPPAVETPAPLEYQPTPVAEQASISVGNTVIVPRLEGANLPRCPNGRVRTPMQSNIPYEAMPGYLCNWFYCPSAGESPAPDARPLMACQKV